MAPKPLLRIGNGAPEASSCQRAPVTSDLARGVASGPPTIRPSSKDGRPDLVRAKCKTPSEETSNKLPKIESSTKIGQPVLTVGSNLRRSGYSPVSRRHESRCWVVIRVEVGLRQQVENKKEVGLKIHRLLKHFNLLVRLK